jgi:hypothetical protein
MSTNKIKIGERSLGERVEDRFKKIKEEKEKKEKARTRLFEKLREVREYNKTKEAKKESANEEEPKKEASKEEETKEEEAKEEETKEEEEKEGEAKEEEAKEGEAKEEEAKEEEQANPLNVMIDGFNSIYPDYESFMNFLGSNVYNGIGQGNDPFYQLYIRHNNFDRTFFILTAPSGYSIFDIPVVYLNDANREYNFFLGMTYLLSIIPHLKPNIHTVEGKVSEHTYFLILDRLIYYYQIYMLYNRRELYNNFRDTAGFIIYMHGAYETYDFTTVRNVVSPVENLFICTKAAPGCVTADYGSNIFDDTKNSDSPLWTMAGNIYEKGFAIFDEVVFRSKPCKRVEQHKNLPFSRGFCYEPDSKSGRSMEHYIGPNSKQYLNKIYEGNRTDFKCYVIDLEQFSKTKVDSSSYLMIHSSNIFNQEFMKDRMKVINNTRFTIYLSDIIDYCAQVLRKKNVFIYDMSCGKTPYNEEDTRLTTDLFSRHRILGGSKRRIRRIRKKTKKNHRNNKRKTKKRLDN